MTHFPFQAKTRHPFFPELAAKPAADARGKSKALAGTFHELSVAAGRGAKASRAVFVNTRLDEFVSEGERDQLWQIFQVPIYAVLVDERGRVVAWECEAQNGLHVHENSGALAAMLDATPCSCGRPGERIVLDGGVADAAD